MAEEIVNDLSETTQLALASARTHRDAWLAGFGLDARLARILTIVSEPMLAQIRLAWWRDQLLMDAGSRPRGDPLLDLIGQSWAGSETALIKLIDGWEALLAEPPMSRESALAFSYGRGEMSAALARYCNANAEQSKRAGRIWALAELATRSTRSEERQLALELAIEQDPNEIALPRSMRPLAVLLGLARRSMRREGAPFLGDRWSPLVGLRLGLLGR